MDDELQVLQEKLNAVYTQLTNFVSSKQNAADLCAECEQLLNALEKFTPVR